MPKSEFSALAIVLLIASAAVAQDAMQFNTPEVARVGDRLACHCKGCKFTVGDCNMPRCGFAEPMRQRIHAMQASGTSDDAIVNTIVREQGVEALSTPPTNSIGGLITWAMPGLMLLAGFFVYLLFVKGKQQLATPLSDTDHALIDRYRHHMDLDE